jgi:ribonuclease E
MSTRMLIDARHPEETRVAVLKGNRIEEFDFESAEHKQIKGNIYLAKVTRVEPSLQAAFVDFGGNRHGFLAFSEIHPDYYQIPKSDRDRLLAEEAAAAEEEAALRAEEDAEDDGSDRIEDDDDRGDDFADGVEEIDTSEKDDVATIEGGQVEDGEDSDEEEGNDEGDDDNRSQDGRGQRRQGNRSRSKEADELRAKRMELRRRYKIQDVIQRRQVLLVQVVKEERGNKGAALTTYLSLAGRYCVLMPNSGHGGGISRKISSASDRKRLKQIVSELALPKSMGCIVRTAGLQRTKTEIKRDFDYLARLWDEIRENTLKSSAPAMIHSDSDLIKRAIRDIYNREIEEVVVEGEEGYRAAREFMKLLMPSHARRVKAYSDPVPLFQRYGAEDQLSAMYDPVVQLKSGGYLVINPTEALVSIDINSGRSTKEHGIEQTALSTNLEAAREIARQLRLRDMAGLVVIDFIDMEYNSNIRKVEKAMKEALKNDRARIQVGRISGFGLMEMSRQRLRTGVLEATTRGCPHCDGTGLVRTASSAGLSALRLIEDEAAKGKGTTITLYASSEAAIYLLNAKRADLAEIERRYGVSVEVIPEGEQEGAKMRIASCGPRPTTMPRFEPIADLVEDDLEEFDDELDEEEEEDEEDRGTGSGPRQETEAEGELRRKRRRRRRGGRNRKRDEEGGSSQSDEGGVERDGAERDADSDGDSDADADAEGDRDETRDATAEGEDGQPRRKRRRRRGGRDRKRTDDSQSGDNAADEAGEDHEATLAETVDGALEAVSADPEPELDSAASTDGEKPKRKPRSRRRKSDDAEAPVAAEAEAEVAAEVPAEPVEATVEALAEADAPAKPKRTRRKKAEAEAPVEDVAPVEEPAPKPARSRRKKAEPEAAEEAVAQAPAAQGEAAGSGESPSADASDDDALDANGEPRRGWWQRTFGA